MEASMSTKKKRKSPKPRKPSAPPKFSVGDQVRVKYGVADPDFADIPLGGWAGTITEVDQRSRSPLYLIEWNQRTLDNMHPIFHKRCERDGLEETSSWQGEEDLEADVGEPVPIEQPTNIVTRPLDKTDQDDRIRAILGLTGDDPLPEANGENLCKYYDYLTAHLSFPFRAVYWRDTGPFQSRKYKVNVVGLVSLDDYYPSEGHGLLCEVRHDADPKEATTVVQGRAKDRGVLLGFMLRMLGFPASQKEEVEEDRCMPLDEMEVKKDSPNRRLMADYSYWFHNH
jgi:hypothetical protein